MAAVLINAGVWAGERKPLHQLTDKEVYFRREVLELAVAERADRASIPAPALNASNSP